MKNKIFLLLLTFIFSSFVSHASWSEAQFNKVSDTWSLNSDGSQEYRHHKEITLFTHTAMNSTYGETFIEYNPKFQEIKIHDSYVIQKDGTKVPTPANSFVEVLPSAAQNASEYNHLKELVVVHMGLELGATIVLDYSIISKSGYLSEIDICKQISQTSPIKEYTLTINTPESKELNITFNSIKATAKKSVKNGVKTATYKFKNIAASSREQLVGIALHNEPMFAANSYSSQKEALNKLSSQFGTSSQVKAIAKEITEGKNSASDKIEAIAAYLQNDIATSALSLAATNYTFRPVDTVLKSAYATSGEKIALFDALLKAVGVESTPVALTSYDIANKAYALSSIESLAIKSGDYLLGSNGMGRVAKYNTNIISLDGAEIIKNGTTPSNIEYKSTISWNASTPSANSSIKVGSYLLPYSSEFASSVAAIKAESSNKTATTASVSGTQTVSSNENGDYMMVYLPATKVGAAQNHTYARLNSTRTNFPIALANPATSESYSYTVDIPSGYSVANSLKQLNTTMSSSVGNIAQTATVDGSKLTINRSININTPTITKSNYSDFRAMMIKWNGLNSKPIMLKK